MPPVDSKEIDSAQILYGSLIRNDLDKKILLQFDFLLFIDILKKNPKKREESFSGDLHPTRRTLGFIGKKFKKL